MTRILIDTDILIDVARAIAPALDRLTTQAQSSTLSISIATRLWNQTTPESFWEAWEVRKKKPKK